MLFQSLDKAEIVLGVQVIADLPGEVLGQKQLSERRINGPGRTEMGRVADIQAGAVKRALHTRDHLEIVRRELLVVVLGISADFSKRLVELFLARGRIIYVIDELL